MRRRDLKAEEKARKAFLASPATVGQDDWESKFSQQLLSAPPLTTSHSQETQKSFNMSALNPKLIREEEKVDSDEFNIWQHSVEKPELSMEFREAYNDWRL